MNTINFLSGHTEKKHTQRLHNDVFCFAFEWETNKNVRYAMHTMDLVLLVLFDGNVFPGAISKCQL